MGDGIQPGRVRVLEQQVVSERVLPVPAKNRQQRPRAVKASGQVAWRDDTPLFGGIFARFDMALLGDVLNQMIYGQRNLLFRNEAEVQAQSVLALCVMLDPAIG